MAKLTEEGAARVVVVCAGAGFGKTTAMTQARKSLEQQGVATAWLTLDVGDSDASRFDMSLQAALRELMPEMAVASVPACGAAALIEQVSAIDFRFVLFLDEFESISSQDVLAIVTQLIERLPREGRLVIGSRVQPALRLGRLRASGHLLTVEARDLRFSFEESRELMQRQHGQDLTPSDVALLHGRTEGWVAGLWLASLALQGRERKHEFIASFSGTDSGLADYLAEEVLSQQHEPMRQFLLRTSILAELSPELCEALVPQAPVRDLLKELTAGNVMVVPSEGQPGAWRYHSLFASFLRAELARESSQEIPGLHRAAAGAFLKLDRPVPAIEHLIAGGMVDAAIALLSEHAMLLLRQGRLRLLTRWFDSLPEDALAGFPLLQVNYAWAVAYTRGSQSALALLERTGLSGSEDAEVRMHVAALRASQLVVVDQWEEGYKVARKALNALPSPSAYADAAVVNVLALAAAVLGLTEESRSMVNRARTSLGQNFSQFHQMYSEGVEGMVDLIAGRQRQARARFRLALRASQSASVHAAHGNAFAGVLHAVCVYESGDVHEAEQLFKVYVPLAREASLTDHAILGLVLLARIAFHDGEVDLAFERLSELEYLGHQRQLPRMVAASRLERAWLLLIQGHADAAAGELRAAADLPLWQQVDSRRYLAQDLDDIDIARARWELVAGEAREAEGQVLRLLDRARAQGRGRRAMKLRLLHAMVCDRLGDEAAPAMLELLREASQEGVVQLFVDEGPLAGLLVQKAAELVGTGIDPLFADFVERVRAAFGPLSIASGPQVVGQPSAPIEELTSAELRVLQLLAEGYSNKALAEKLFVSHSTVRTHLRHINSKLGADNRTQAVAVARRQGLMR